MKFGITLISLLAPMLVPMLASAQTAPLDNNIGSCTEESQFQPYYLLNGGAERLPGVQPARHDHYLDLTIEADPSTGVPILGVELGTGSAQIEYEDSGRRSGQRLDSRVEWRGNLRNQGSGRFSSNDGVGLTLTEQSVVQPASTLIQDFALPITETTVYHAEITRPGGETIRLTCELSRNQLAVVDRNLRHSFVRANTIEDKRDVKPVPQPPAPRREPPDADEILNAAVHSGVRQI